MFAHHVHDTVRRCASDLRLESASGEGLLEEEREHRLRVVRDKWLSPLPDTARKEAVAELQRLFPAFGSARQMVVNVAPRIEPKPRTVGEAIAELASMLAKIPRTESVDKVRDAVAALAPDRKNEMVAVLKEVFPPPAVPAASNVRPPSPPLSPAVATKASGALPESKSSVAATSPDKSEAKRAAEADNPGRMLSVHKELVRAVDDVNKENGNVLNQLLRRLEATHRYTQERCDVLRPVSQSQSLEAASDAAIKGINHEKFSEQVKEFMLRSTILQSMVLNGPAKFAAFFVDDSFGPNAIKERVDKASVWRTTSPGKCWGEYIRTLHAEFINDMKDSESGSGETELDMETMKSGVESAVWKYMADTCQQDSSSE